MIPKSVLPVFENPAMRVLLIIRCGVAPGGGATPFSFAQLPACRHKSTAINRLCRLFLLNFPYPMPIPGGIIKAAMERSVYRIIDANFNRAREAVRVIEEFCRFALNSSSLTERAKQLRHELCAAIGKLDAGRLISSRDTLGDVGIGQTIDKQLRRTGLNDSFAAGCKRLTEALRTLTEMTQTLSPPVAETIEKLRYAAYTLEKDIVLFSSTAEKFKRVGLYVIISSSLPADVRP